MGQGCKAVDSGDGARSCCCLSLEKAACRWWAEQVPGVLARFLQCTSLTLLPVAKVQ